MGFFESEARVSLSEVERFKESVEHFYTTVENVKNQMVNELKDEMERIEVGAEKMKALATNCRSLYEESKRLESDISRAITRLKAQLQSTPKEISQEKTGEGGEKATVKKPNPEYNRLIQEIKKHKSRLSRAKDASWRIYNKESELRRNSEYLFSMTAELEQDAKSVKDALQSLEQKTSSARYSLENTIQAIGGYMRQRIAD